MATFTAIKGQNMADVKGHTLMLDPDEWDLILDDGGQIVDTSGASAIVAFRILL